MPHQKQMFCAKCGEELNISWTHCPKCGLRVFSAQREKSPSEPPRTPLNISGKEAVISRTAETILGVLGGVFGLGGAFFALTVGGLGGAFSLEEASEVVSLGLLAIFFSILGIVGGAIASRNSKVAGILMLVAGIGGLVAISLGYIVAAPLLIVGGILSLVRKGKKEGGSKSQVSEEKETKKPWYKRWWGIGLILVGILLVIAILAGSPEEGKPQTGTTPEQKAKEYRFSDRLDKQATDIELKVGEFTTIEGLKVGITKTQRTTAFSEFEEASSGKEFVIVTISYENVSDETQSYNPFDLRIQTAKGQVLDHYWFNPRGDNLESGDLISGGKVSGTVVFEVPKEKGHQYILYKPNPFRPDRIVVQIK